MGIFFKQKEEEKGEGGKKMNILIAPIRIAKTVLENLFVLFAFLFYVVGVNVAALLGILYRYYVKYFLISTFIVLFNYFIGIPQGILHFLSHFFPIGGSYIYHLIFGTPLVLIHFAAPEVPEEERKEKLPFQII